MISDGDSRRNALRDAIRLETDGRDFFLKASEKTSDYFGRIIFRSLAEEECRHIERINAIDRSLGEKGEWPFPEGGAEERGENIFEKARKQMDETVRDRTDDLAAVKIAMDLEEKGIQYYSDLAAKAADPRERQFYERLAAEEKRHLEILENTWSTIAEHGSSAID